MYFWLKLYCHDPQLKDPPKDEVAKESWKMSYLPDASNLTLGLPFLRITPDHGTNNKMIGKNLSDPTSLIKAIKFAKKFS